MPGSCLNLTRRALAIQLFAHRVKEPSEPEVRHIPYCARPASVEDIGRKAGEVVKANIEEVIKDLNNWQTPVRALGKTVMNAKWTITWEKG